MKTENFWCVYFPLIMLVVGTIIAFIIWWFLSQPRKLKLKRPHIHWYGTPIVSIYRSFNYRDVIYECSCGQRYLVKGVRHDSIYGRIQTAICITGKEIDSILAGEENELNTFIINSCKIK